MRLELRRGDHIYDETCDADSTGGCADASDSVIGRRARDDADPRRDGPSRRYGSATLSKSATMCSCISLPANDFRYQTDDQL